MPAPSFSRRSGVETIALKEYGRREENQSDVHHIVGTKTKRNDIGLYVRRVVIWGDCDPEDPNAQWSVAFRGKGYGKDEDPYEQLVSAQKLLTSETEQWNDTPSTELFYLIFDCGDIYVKNGDVGDETKLKDLQSEGDAGEKSQPGDDVINMQTQNKSS